MQKRIITVSYLTINLSVGADIIRPKTCKSVFLSFSPMDSFLIRGSPRSKQYYHNLHCIKNGTALQTVPYGYSFHFSFKNHIQSKRAYNSRQTEDYV